MTDFPKPKLPSAFRAWLTNKWYEHKDEVDRWGGEPFADAGVYFRTYKWWLKTLYKKEQADLKRREEMRKKYGKFA